MKKKSDSECGTVVVGWAKYSKPSRGFTDLKGKIQFSGCLVDVGGQRRRQQ